MTTFKNCKSGKRRKAIEADGRTRRSAAWSFVINEHLRRDPGGVQPAQYSWKLVLPSYRLPSGDGQNMVAPKKLKNQKTHLKKQSPWLKRGLEVLRLIF